MHKWISHEEMLINKNYIISIEKKKLEIEKNNNITHKLVATLISGDEKILRTGTETEIDKYLDSLEEELNIAFVLEDVIDGEEIKENIA